MGAYNPFILAVSACLHVSVLFLLNLVLVLIKMTLGNWRARLKVPRFHCQGNIFHSKHLEINMKHMLPFGIERLFPREAETEGRSASDSLGVNPWAFS